MIEISFNFIFLKSPKSSEYIKQTQLKISLYSLISNTKLFIYDDL